MRIAIAGISSESSMFSLARTEADRFQVLRGEELLAQYRFPERLGAIVDGVEWVPTMRAAGQSGGPIDPVFYDGAVAEILALLRAGLDGGAYDGVYVDMHGAMHVDGREDAEEHFVRAVREIVGPDALLAMSMDPHGNLSRELATLVDLAAAHRHSPHIDAAQTVERTVTQLIETVRSGRRPLKAWVRIPVLLPGERTGTFVEPGRTVFGMTGPASARRGVLDANLWVGYAWADEPRNAAAALVTGDSADAVTATAEELAAAYWDARADFAITAEAHGTIDEALDHLVGGAARPLFISDAGDNSTGGADGDAAYVLNAVLSRAATGGLDGLRILVAALYDPASLDRALQAGVGGAVEEGVGSWISGPVSPPARGPWRVVELVDGHWGEGVVAALLRREVGGAVIDVTVQRRRAVFTTPDDSAYFPRKVLGQAWIDPAGRYDAVVVKNGYLFPGQVAAAGSEFMALTPGGTDMDFSRLPFARAGRPIFPLDTGFTPDLTAQLLPSWSPSPQEH